MKRLHKLGSRSTFELLEELVAAHDIEADLVGPFGCKWAILSGRIARRCIIGHAVLLRGPMTEKQPVPEGYVETRWPPHPRLNCQRSRLRLLTKLGFRTSLSMYAWQSGSEEHVPVRVISIGEAS